MKYIENISLRFLQIALVAVLVSSCTVDSPTIVIPKTTDQYIQEFRQLVTSESSTVRSCKVGYDKGNFTPVSTSSFATFSATYLKALVADSAVIASPGVTITQLVNANTSLAVPGKAFWGKINISDRRPLNDLIVTATTLNNSIVAGSLTGNVTQAAKTAFTTAIATATTTRDALATIDRQVTDGITALNLAIITFNNSIIK